MQYIVIDLEWNGGYSKKAHGYFNEIIEVGAVRLNAAMELTDTFQANVRPVVSKKLSGIVTDLTNITPEELEDGTTFPDLMAQLARFAGTEPTVWLTWSNTDLLVMMENCRFFFGKQEIPGLEYYMDFQVYAQQRMGIDGGQQIGLARAGEMLGISEENMALHRALDDSRLTAQILQKVYEPVSFAAAVQRVDEEFYRRVTFKTVIISDIDDPMVKRSELHFSCPECGRELRRKDKWRFSCRAFCADFSCKTCLKEYRGRVQFRQKYEGVECRKKLTEKLPRTEEAAAAAAAE